MFNRIKGYVLRNKAIVIVLTIAILSGCIGMIVPHAIKPAINENNGVKVPIIMYHSILKSAKVKTKYIVTPAQFEEDLVWLKNNGYTSIFMSDLINYVYDGTPLPEKPIIITFDDGYYNNLTYMYPLLVKYDMKAVISVVCSYSEEFSKTMDLNPAYAHLTWDNIKELSNSGYVEIQNHSYNMHTNDKRKGCSILKGEDEGEYKKILSTDIMKAESLLNDNCGISTNTFTYPFGYICTQSEEIIKELGFKASLSCYENMNYITRDTNCLYSLKRFNRDSRLSTSKFMSKIDK